MARNVVLVFSLTCILTGTSDMATHSLLQTLSVETRSLRKYRQLRLRNELTMTTRTVLTSTMRCRLCQLDNRDDESSK